MPDQAAGLRNLFARRRPSLLIVAGADACKAAVAVHFAREAAAGKRATLMVDGTPGQLASACDLACRYELSHVLAGDMALGDVIQALTPHLLLLPVARALSRYGSFSVDEDGRLADAFANGVAQALTAAGADETQVDLIVVNADEGSAGLALEAFGRDARVVIVASDQPHSLRAAYAELKSLSQVHAVENFEIVVPCFEESAPSGVAFVNLSNTARRFLDISLVDGGSIVVPEPKPAARAARLSPLVRTKYLPSAAAGDPSSSDSPDAADATLPTSITIDEVPHAAAVA